MRRAQRFGLFLGYFMGPKSLKFCCAAISKCQSKTGSENGTTVGRPTAKEKVGPCVCWLLGQEDHEILLVYEDRLFAMVLGVELRECSSDAWILRTSSSNVVAKYPGLSSKHALILLETNP
jgi:hypothetical protein